MYTFRLKLSSVVEFYVHLGNSNVYLNRSLSLFLISVLFFTFSPFVFNNVVRSIVFLYQSRQKVACYQSAATFHLSSRAVLIFALTLELESETWKSASPLVDVATSYYLCYHLFVSVRAMRKK